jgi:hypothetical protein
MSSRHANPKGVSIRNLNRLTEVTNYDAGGAFKNLTNSSTMDFRTRWIRTGLEKMGKEAKDDVFWRQTIFSEQKKELERQAEGFPYFVLDFN